MKKNKQKHRKEERPPERERPLLRASCPGVTGRSCQHNSSVEMPQGPHSGEIQVATSAKASISVAFVFLLQLKPSSRVRDLLRKIFCDLENIATGVLGLSRQQADPMYRPGTSGQSQRLQRFFSKRTRGGTREGASKNRNFWGEGREPGRRVRVTLPRCHKDMGASRSTCTAQMQTLTNENRKAKPD